MIYFIIIYVNVVNVASLRQVVAAEVYFIYIKFINSVKEKTNNHL